MTTLAEIRHQAALNCGLAEYPAELIAAYEAIDVRGRAWSMVHPEQKLARLARFDASRLALGLPPRKVDRPARST